MTQHVRSRQGDRVLTGVPIDAVITFAASLPDNGPTVGQNRHVFPRGGISLLTSKLLQLFSQIRGPKAYCSDRAFSSKVVIKGVT